jgi:hypothetical protein
MVDEHEQQFHQLEQAQAQDSTSGYLGIPWYDRMTPEERERQVEKRLPKSGVIATWAILIGVAVLVVLGVVLPAR